MLHTTDSEFEETFMKEANNLLGGLNDDEIRLGYQVLVDSEDCAIPDFQEDETYHTNHYYDALKKFQVAYIKQHIIPSLTKEKLIDILDSTRCGYGLCNSSLFEMIRVIINNKNALEQASGNDDLEF